MDLREILLQKSTDSHDFDYMVIELVIYTCNEIAHGISTVSRNDGYIFLNILYQVPNGKTMLAKLGRPGGVLEKVAQKMADK
jgi:hypothetical protein